MNVDKDGEPKADIQTGGDIQPKMVTTKGDKNIEMSYLLSPKTSLG